jgi:hypothetical protein
MPMKSATGTPTIHGHIADFFGFGTKAPHFGQEKAVVLI